ncbi:MAG: hypothetical protein M3536_09260 [Actinomycetota bacterium]|nr:hypothetical protein [Actinomycetota bacterium]
MIIRAIPQWAGQPEQFYDISKLPWKEQRDFTEELGQQNFYVQTIHLADPMPVLVGIEVRRKLEAEQESQ